MAGRVGAAVVGTACVASVLLVGGSYQFILGRQEELAMHLKEEAARRQRQSTSPGLAAGQEEIAAMLTGVKGKTLSQKLEAVHDAGVVRPPPPPRTRCRPPLPHKVGTTFLPAH